MALHYTEPLSCIPCARHRGIGVNWSIRMRFLGRRRRRRRVFGGHVRYQLIMMFRGAR